MSDIELAKSISDLQRRVAELERREKPRLHQGARVYNSGNISITSGNVTTLSFSTVRYDDGGFRTGATSQLIAPYACWATLSTMIGFSFNATGIREVWIEVGGVRIGESYLSANAQAEHYVTVSADWKMAAGDIAIVRAFQNSGSTLTIQSSAARSPEFAIHLW